MTKRIPVPSNKFLRRHQLSNNVVTGDRYFSVYSYLWEKKYPFLVIKCKGILWCFFFLFGVFCCCGFVCLGVFFKEGFNFCLETCTCCFVCIYNIQAGLGLCTQGVAGELAAGGLFLVLHAKNLLLKFHKKIMKLWYRLHVCPVHINQRAKISIL